MIRKAIVATIIATCCVTFCASAEDITLGVPATIQVTRPDSSGDVWYAVKLPVLNKTSHFLYIMIELQAIDKDGFELDTVSLRATLQPSKSDVLTDKTFMSYAQYRSIAKWQIKDSSQRVVEKPPIVVSDVATRLQSRPDSSGDVWYAIKADVANLGDTPLRGVELQAVDGNGYEIDSVTLMGNVSPRQRSTLSEKTFMQDSDFKRIARWRHVDD